MNGVGQFAMSSADLMKKFILLTSLRSTTPMDALCRLAEESGDKKVFAQIRVNAMVVKPKRRVSFFFFFCIYCIAHNGITSCIWMTPTVSMVTCCDLLSKQDCLFYLIVALWFLFLCTCNTENIHFCISFSRSIVFTCFPAINIINLNIFRSLKDKSKVPKLTPNMLLHCCYNTYGGCLSGGDQSSAAFVK